MLQVYPFGSGSLYTASFAITASYAPSAQFIAYVNTASKAGTVLTPRSGSDGKGVCKITTAEYELLKTYKLIGLLETCSFD